MTMNKLVIYITITFIVLVVGIPTLNKVIKENHQKLEIVNEKKIYESAIKCIAKKMCSDKKVTLKDLYENKLLNEDIINPVTKEVYNENSYIIINKDSYEVVLSV